MQRSGDSPEVLVFPPLLFGSMLAIGLLLYWFHPVPLLRPLVARLLGLGLLILSGVLARSAERVMKRAGTNIRPDQPTLALVTNGPFRWTRNPLYMAAIGLYVSIALLVNTVWPLAFLIPLLLVLNWGVIRREERYLEAKFGEPYRVYRARVPRWL